MASIYPRPTRNDETAPPPLCTHEDFEAQVTVVRLADQKPPFCFQANITISCAACGAAFVFLGLPPGVDLHGAAASFDRTEARLAIAAASEVPWYRQHKLEAKP